MEEVEKDPEETTEASLLSENQQAKKGESTRDAAEDPSIEVHANFNEEPWESHEEEVEESEKKMINLQRDLTTFVTNIQTAADARESMRRTEMEEARRMRLERLEKNEKFCQEIYEEFTKSWSIIKQKVIPQELQEALNNHQQICGAILEDKKKLINDLQQELKCIDDCYVKDLRKQAEELDVMMERMEEQIKALTNAYREELAQLERIYQRESEILLERDKTEWDQLMKQLWDEELERLAQRKKKVEEYEAIIHDDVLKTDTYNPTKSAKLKLMEKEHQYNKLNASKPLNWCKQLKQKDDSRFNLTQIKRRTMSLKKVLTNLQAAVSSQKKQIATKRQNLSEDYKRNIQQHERLQKKIKHFAVADARKFEEMRLMLEAEMKQQVERVLDIDSQICMHLGLAWERPALEFMEFSGPIQPQKQACRPAHQAVPYLFHTSQALQSNQRLMDQSVGPKLETDTESADMGVYEEETAVQSESDAEEGKLSMEILKKVMEQLCDEAGFLMEDKLLNLLAHLEKEEHTIVKLSSLLCSFGIEEEDVPKLADFLLKYKDQQREQTEDVCVESGESSIKETTSTAHLTSELIDPNNVVPALKSFLEQQRKLKCFQRKSSDSKQHSFHVEVQDTSAYWDRMANIISDDRMKLWDAAEIALKQHHTILTENSELISETQSLKQQNAELRMLLQSRVTTEVEKS